MPGHEEIHIINMDGHDEGHDGMGGCEGLMVAVWRNLRKHTHWIYGIQKSTSTPCTPCRKKKERKEK